MLWIGIDVGGTFTDAVAYDQTRNGFTFAKAPSTPADPTRAVLDVLKAIELDIPSIERLVHGVTIGTNAVLEGKGAEVWMLVTKGFKDVLEIGRTNRPVLYDIRTQKAPPLVPRTRALEIDERLLFDGTVLKPIDLAEVDRVTSGIPERRDAAITICFLHSYANASHELAAKATVTGARPDQFVCTSHEVLPQFREYERFNTTALNAYIGPLMDRYLTRLEAGLREQGFQHDLHIMTSTGGIATAARARRLPVSTILSGPSAGVAAAVHLGAQLGIANIITCDMGGTSTDVCLIEGLKVPVTSEQKISHYSNRTPQIEINSVGAGGGSIAWLDAGDILMVGPQSAGAHPGPACYGRGGTEVTVTDANLVLNRLSVAPRASGHLSIDPELAFAALEKLGRRVGLDTLALADGIIRIAVARMVSAIKQISIANGHDPRDFVLLAYGGAGPMHATAVAEELEINRVLVPIGPGNFAAFGALISDIRFDYTRTRTMQLDDTAAREIAATFASMESEARDQLRADGVPDARIEIGRALGMRYLGQSWELIVDLPPVPADSAARDARNAISVEHIKDAFAGVHDRRFGHRSGGTAEIVSFRVAAIGRLAKPALPPLQEAKPLDIKPITVRRVYFTGGFVECPVYARDGFGLGNIVAGPAVIEESGSTTIVPPGWTASAVSHGELIMERSGHG